MSTGKTANRLVAVISVSMLRVVILRVVILWQYFRWFGRFTGYFSCGMDVFYYYRISIEAEEISIRPHPASIDRHHRGAIARESAPSPPKPRKAAGNYELEL